ncbi:class I SAM-dependent DNA methyltransferase [Oceanicaulis sp. LC35]|uniref:class I SAM-dependent DNA methyltransferase n=1 Tax=Oceanicaulis sp. LC35 TaxID=3349635 RepID=UPI003F82B3DC
MTDRDREAEARGAAAIADIYERHAERFDARRRSAKTFMEAGWMARFLALAAPSGRILDLGCGSGFPIAAHLIEQGFDVEGVDIAPAMIALCQKSWPGQTWRVGDMRTVTLAGPYAGALAWHSSFHLPGLDQAQLIAHIGTALAPGAPFMFTSGDGDGVAWGDMFGDRLFHASLAPAQFESALEEAGLEIIDRVLWDDSCGGASVWLTRKRHT